MSLFKTYFSVDYFRIHYCRLNDIEKQSWESDGASVIYCYRYTTSFHPFQLKMNCYPTTDDCIRITETRVTEFY